jgi:hypothetical protein
MVAAFAEASYILNDKKLTKQQRIDKANAELAKKGYEVHPKSGTDVQLFVQREEHADPNKRHVVMTHRGTDFSGRKIKKDVLADIAYMTGNENVFTKQFKKRSNATKKLMKEVKDSDHLTMTGHSYGGASINHTLVNEPSVRNRVDNVELYNPLLHHAGSAQVKTGRGEKKSDVNSHLNELITVHRTKNDIASASKPQHGKVKNYKQKVHSTKKTNPFQDVFNKVEQLSAHSLKNFI